jgi:ribonuclease HI
MSQIDYQHTWRALKKYKLTDINSIKATNQKMKSFSVWANSLPVPQRNKLIELSTTPIWYQTIIKTLNPTATNVENVEVSHLITYRPQINLASFMLPINSRISPSNSLDAWVDGSLQNNQMGAGIVYTIPSPNQTSTTQHVILKKGFKLTPQQPSSTKPELYAIYGALLQTSPPTELTIFTDSQTSLDLINRFTTTTLSDREIIKTPNYGILEAIQSEFNKFETTPTIQKVRAHIGLPLNELADRVAKDAVHNPHLGPIEYLSKRLTRPQHRQLHIFLNNVRQELYPGTIIRKRHLMDNTTKLHTKLQQIWGDTINIERTLTCTRTGMGRKHKLDASSTAEHKFRINLITRKLHSLTNSTKYRQTMDPTCRRCKLQAEDYEHIFACQSNNLAGLQSKAAEILVHRYPHLPPNTFGILGLGSDLTTPISKGIFTQDLILHSQNNNLSTRDTDQIMDSWLSAIYSVIWIERNKAT